MPQLTEKENTTCLSLGMAAYRAAHDHPGGVPAIAGAFGWNPRTLQNKLNPTQEFHKLTVDELEGILQLTQDARILDAVCAQRDAMWVDLGRVKGVASDMAMLDDITKLVERVGKLSGSVHSSLADGVVDDDEMHDLETCAMRLMQSALLVVERAKQYRG